MSQRDSGYARIERDAYQTPPWPVAALKPHIPERVKRIWEPAAGEGQMVRALVEHGYAVESSDVFTGQDFFLEKTRDVDAIITNPPYNLAEAFIRRAMALTRDDGGIVAMLLRTDYDHAAGRAHLFAGSRVFAKKVVLTKRIVWIERKGAAPSFNHAWYLWDWRHFGPPTIAYGP